MEDFSILVKCEMIKFWLTWGKADHTLELRNQGNWLRALEGTQCQALSALWTGPE